MPRGSLGKERDTRVVRRTPVETSPRVAISGSIHRFLPSCPHPGSRRANTQTTSMGVFSVRVYPLAQRNFRKRPVGAKGSAEESQASALVQGRDGNLPGGGFHNSDQSKFTHSQLSDGDLNLYSVRRKNFAVSPS